MAQLRQDYQRFSQLDTEIVAVGPEGADVFKKYWTQEGLPFVGIPDPGHRFADLYGQEVRLLKLGRLPAQILIDKDGIVRHCHYGTSMMDIIPDADFFRLLENFHS